MRVFGSVERLRKASVQDIAAVSGVGPSLAARIKAGLTKK
ncbi:MAG: helix-hairpin-helix domain-containing protein [Chthoniobacterales bacterium]